jgi:hypothetical protein
MRSMTTQKDLIPKDPENAQKLNGPVEGICGAPVDYQVCTPRELILIASNISLRASAVRAATGRSWVSLLCGPAFCNNL